MLHRAARRLGGALVPHPRRPGGRAHVDHRGIARDANGKLNALQQAFQNNHALQCGFCTPGILMSFTDFLERNPDPSEAEVIDVLSGHLCRCTGYAGIVSAVLEAAGRPTQQGAEMNKPQNKQVAKTPAKQAFQLMTDAHGGCVRRASAGNPVHSGRRSARAVPAPRSGQASDRRPRSRELDHVRGARGRRSPTSRPRSRSMACERAAACCSFPTKTWKSC